MTERPTYDHLSGPVLVGQQLARRWNADRSRINQVEMLLTHWREELADYPLNTPAAQRLRTCIEELEQTIAIPPSPNKSADDA